MRRFIKIIQILLILTLFFSAYKIIDYYKTARKSQEKQEEILRESKIWEEEVKSTLFSESEAGNPEALLDKLAISKIKFLQEKYPAVIGWIYIPETNIDYPFV